MRTIQRFGSASYVESVLDCRDHSFDDIGSDIVVDGHERETTRLEGASGDGTGIVMDFQCTETTCRTPGGCFLAIVLHLWSYTDTKQENQYSISCVQPWR